MTDDAITAAVTDPLLRRGPGRGWWLALALRFASRCSPWWRSLVVLGRGIGVLGNNTAVVWGLPIANYVWWIGIGNAGTLISALLLLTRQEWRASINRFAEAMTLFAVSIAGLFPILHLGRPLYFYWLFALPEHHDALAAMAKRAGLGFLGDTQLSPVLDRLLLCRPAARSRHLSRSGEKPTGAAHLRSARARLARLGVAMARSPSLLHDDGRLAVPLVCSVHSIVGLDFAASLMPGWQETIFPPYFVVGAMFSGFAMVVLLAAAIRWGFGFEALLTRRHFEAMAMIILASSLIMTLSYATEWFSAGTAANRPSAARSLSPSRAPMRRSSGPASLQLRAAAAPVVAGDASRSLAALVAVSRRRAHRHVA